MIRMARNIRRKTFEGAVEVKEDNRRGRYFSRERLREIEDRLARLEKKTGIIKE